MSRMVMKSLIGSSSSYKLHQVLIFAVERKHVIIFEDPELLHTWVSSQESSLHSVYRSAIELSSRAAATLASDAATIYIVEEQETTWADPVSHCTIDEAVAILNEPLGVFVENADNDWHFLCGLMRPSERERINTAIANGTVVALHGGGATLTERIRSRASIPGRAVRTFAMFDSDRRHPDELDPSWSPTGQEACQGYIVEIVAKQFLFGRYWMLSRRFIESYMPIAEIRGAISANVPLDAPDAFARLSRDAQWYFNMKKGFAGDSAVENAHRKKDLFEGISDDDKNALMSGFGRKLADRYSQLATREFDWDEAALQESARAISNVIRLL